MGRPIGQNVRFILYDQLTNITKDDRRAKVALNVSLFVRDDLGAEGMFDFQAHVEVLGQACNAR
jgi:hypothetical protein